ncbi:MAG: DUF433 domain-containing protein [Caldilineaceae bacterium]
MQLEDYFDFIAPNDIRIKGHRIGIEDLLYEYIHNALTPDELAIRFPSLTLEEIYATLLYYTRNKTAIDQYLREWLEHSQTMWRKQQANPSAGMLRLRQLRSERLATLGTEQQERVAV